MRADLPVVVVGAGPVGLLAALLLAAEGARVVVVEREREPSQLPRAVHLDDEALRVLQGLGLLRALRPHLSPAETYELRDGSGRLLHAFTRSGQPLGHPRSVLVHQPEVETVLRAAAEACPLISVHRGVEVVGISERPAAVTVRALARAGGSGAAGGGDGAAAGTDRIDASAVLACDGATSTVRRLLSIASHDHRFDQDWLVVDVLLEDRPPALDRPQQRCDPGRPATSVPVGPARHRLEVMLGRPGAPASPLEPGALGHLLRDWRLDPAGVTVERAAVYAFHALNARVWRSGDVFLLGDAAHQMPPFLGQGLCSGFRDAANLCWKLALALRLDGAEALLDTYAAERRPHVTGVIRRTALIGRVITGRGPVAAVARRAGAGVLRTVGPIGRAAAALQPPPLPAGPLVARRAGGVAGRPFPQPVLAAPGGAVVPADEVLGVGFALVGWGRDPLARADGGTRRFWSALGARSVALAAAEPGGAAPAQDTATGEGATASAGPAVDVTGALESWLRAARAEVAVVRPDRVVLGVVAPGDHRGLERLGARLAACLR